VQQESAQERLRRLMKAQLDNAFQKDSLAATQKKMQVGQGVGKGAGAAAWCWLTGPRGWFL
jgi:hypothetical protein